MCKKYTLPIYKKTVTLAQYHSVAQLPTITLLTEKGPCLSQTRERQKLYGLNCLKRKLACVYMYLISLFYGEITNEFEELC